MASSNALSSSRWALVSGVVVVVGTVVGVSVWHETHPGAPVRLAALAPVLPPFASPSPVPAALKPAPAAQTSSQASASPAPTFDIVRVEPSGDSVIAGKGDPGADVSLLASGKVVAEAKADENGQFVMTPAPLKPGAYDLTLQQTQPGRSTQRSAQAVAVAVPASREHQVVVALDEPGKPTKVLAAPAPAGPLAIRSVELENGTGFFATGSARPGRQIHVYLNGSHLADVTAAPDGQWTLRIGKGLTGGHYTVRADSVGADRTSIDARAEVPFDVPVAMAQAPAVASDAPVPQLAAAGQQAAVIKANSNAVVGSIETARVVSGDNLWDISRVRFGDGTRYTRIYTANAGQIRDPNLIYPGQVFVVPRD